MSIPKSVVEVVLRSGLQRDGGESQTRQQVGKKKIKRERLKEIERRMQRISDAIHYSLDVTALSVTSVSAAANIECSSKKCVAEDIKTHHTRY